MGRLAVVEVGGSSVVSEAYATSPLRLLIPNNHGHAVWVYTSSFGGGLVDGDVLSLSMSVGAGAAAFLSTQSATKVYRSPRGTEVTLRARVEDDGLLVVAPDAVVCFAGARFSQHQQLDVAATGSVVLLDWVTSGRRESGERWGFEHYVSRTVVRVEGRPVVHDAVALRASDGDLMSRLGAYDVLLVAVVLGRRFEREVEHLVAGVDAAPAPRRADSVVTAARVGDAGCLVRMAGRTVEDVEQRLRALLAFVPRHLGDSPWARKW